VLHARVGRWLKSRLSREAEARGVELSALVRAVLKVHVDDLGSEILGWQENDVSVVQLVRPERVEITVRKRRLRR
jgi:hypothetical protein